MPPSEPEQAPILTDEDIFDDQLGKRFGWKDIQTSALAKVLMVKWDQDVEKFSDHLKFLQMNKLNERDLQSLLGLLYYDVKAYDLWKKAEQKGLAVHTVAELVAAKLPDRKLNLSNEPRDVVVAISNVIAEI
jgi:hypothetical protein